MGRSPSASTRSLAVGDSDEGEGIVDKGEKRIQALKKELAELRIKEDEVRHKLRSEIGRVILERLKNESLQRNLQKSKDLVAQLEKRPP